MIIDGLSLFEQHCRLGKSGKGGETKGICLKVYTLQSMEKCEVACFFSFD
jgi:hypothetical protein